MMMGTLLLYSVFKFFTVGSYRAHCGHCESLNNSIVTSAPAGPNALAGRTSSPGAAIALNVKHPVIKSRAIREEERFGGFRIFIVKW